MTSHDESWVQKLVANKVLSGPVLELGTGYGGETCRKIMVDAGLSYYGTDLEKTPTVDFVANFEQAEDMKIFTAPDLFGTILVLNVLEHTFDPIRILDNVISILKPGGNCVIITPTLWPLHNFPIDVWRPLPNFYEEYALRRHLRLNPSHFDYIGRGPIHSYRDAQNNYSYPPPTDHPFLSFWSRGIHKAFNTFGRRMFQSSHLAIGAILQKPAS